MAPSSDSASLASDHAPVAGDVPVWHAMAAADVAARLEVDPADGLSSAQVAERVERYGLNRLAEPPRARAGSSSSTSSAAASS